MAMAQAFGSWNPPAAATRGRGWDEDRLMLEALFDRCDNCVPETEDDDAVRFGRLVRGLRARHAFRPAFATDEWRIFGTFCISRRVGSGYRLRAAGVVDPTLRFLVDGNVQETHAGPGRVPAQVLQPGCIVGEETLFVDGPAEREVRALGECLVLELARPRHREFAAAHPELAVEMLRAAGAVVAARLEAIVERREAMSEALRA